MCSSDLRRMGEMATLDAVRRGVFEPPSSVNPDIPAMLDQVVRMALAVDPANRYQSATQFKEALDRFCHEVGFITSAPQLARFLKELLPDSTQKPEREAEELMLDDLPVPPPMVPEQQVDESTLIRPMPKASDWGEMQTVIREEPKPRPAALPPPKPEVKIRVVERKIGRAHV